MGSRFKARPSSNREPTSGEEVGHPSAGETRKPARGGGFSSCAIPVEMPPVATFRVTTGGTVRLAPYAERRLQASSDAALRLLWIRWAPGGDQAYVDAGYYLTGANQHVQPEQANLPWDYQLWGEAFENEALEAPSTPVADAPPGSAYAAAAQALGADPSAVAELNQVMGLLETTPRNAYAIEPDSQSLEQVVLFQAGPDQPVAKTAGAHIAAAVLL